ncbi:DUF7503 family protein [Natronobiforma cellulositropha]|nr:hypothetical protein [Natronobiforma cellulositropha]
MSDTKTPIRTFLLEHPRLTGALLTTALVVSQVGTVAAGNGGATT